MAKRNTTTANNKEEKVMRDNNELKQATINVVATTPGAKTPTRPEDTRRDKNRHEPKQINKDLVAIDPTETKVKENRPTAAPATPEAIAERKALITDALIKSDELRKQFMEYTRLWDDHGRKIRTIKADVCYKNFNNDALAYFKSIQDLMNRGDAISALLVDYAKTWPTEYKEAKAVFVDSNKATEIKRNALMSKVQDMSSEELDAAMNSLK